MASREHIQPLLASIASMSMGPWNRWRIENPSIRPDFSGVELADANLSFAYLSYADLSHADLSRTNFRHATLRYADLSLACLRKADLVEADLSYSTLKGADLEGAILRNAKLRGTNLIGANLKDADLRGADLAQALMDPNAIEGQKKRFGRGVSYLEKLALGLFPRAKRKDHSLPDESVKPHRSDESSPKANK